MGIFSPNKSFVQFPTLDEVLEIHNELIKRFGGPAGVHDMGLLESVLFRPQSGYYLELTEMAAALFESLTKTNPFVDGNKRADFVSCDIFLRLNGYKFKLEAKKAYQFLVGFLEKDECNRENLHLWIKGSIETI